MTDIRGVADGFEDEVLGSANGFDGGVAEDEEAEEGGGEGTAGAVGGGGFEVLAGESVDLSGGQAEDVRGLGVVAGRGDDVEMGVAEGQGVGGGFRFGEGSHGLRGERGEFRPVGRDPGDEGQKVAVEDLDCVVWEQGRTGAGAKDWIEDDGTDGVADGVVWGVICGGLIPCRLGALPRVEDSLIRSVEGSQKTGDGRGDWARSEHSDLDPGGGQVGDQLVEGPAEEGWVGRLDLGDTEGGLDRKCCNHAGSKEAVGGKGLKIRSDSSAGGRIVAGDRQQTAYIRA